MLEPVFESFEKLIDQFSWKRMIFLSLFILFAISGLLIFESYTGYFKLNRLEKSVNLLKNLNEIGNSSFSNRDKDLRLIYDELKKELNNSLKNKYKMSLDFKILIKALSGAAPWIILSLFFINGIGKEKDTIYALSGTIIFGFLSAIIGIYLPLFKWSIINYIIYPWGVFIVIIIIALIKLKQKSVKIKI
jgi:hypothetical protein